MINAKHPVKSEPLHYLRLYLNRNGKLSHLRKAKPLSILYCKCLVPSEGSIPNVSCFPSFIG